MGEADETAVGGPTVADRERESGPARPWRWAFDIGVLAAALFALVLLLGFPGPGAARRYPLTSLLALADRINATLVQPICDPTPGPAGRVKRYAAHVDLLRSRVVLEEWPGGGTKPIDHWTVLDSPELRAAVGGDRDLIANYPVFEPISCGEM